MKKGFTLIELILVIVIGSMVSAFTFSFIYNSIQTYRLMRTQRQLHQDATYALDRITRELRDASFGISTSSGISFIKSHQTPTDSNTFVRYYQSGSTLFRCSDSVFGLICLFNPGSSPTNKPICANLSSFTVQQNTNGSPCDASNLPNCQDDSFSVTIGLAREGHTLTLGTSITPKNYCARGASAPSCSAQDYSNRSFNRDYYEVVN